MFNLCGLPLRRLNKGTNDTSALRPFQRAWLNMIENDLAPFPIITRQSLYKTAWMAQSELAGVTIQITSDKTVYVAPPPGPASRKASRRFTLTTLVMMQLMLRDMENVPNATLIIKFSDNCLREFTSSLVLSEMNYTEMENFPSSWDSWLLNGKGDLRPGPDSIPTTDIAPLLHYMRTNGGEPSLDCLGVALPNYDWLVYHLTIDAAQELQRDYLSEVPWEKRIKKLVWRGNYRPESRPIFKNYKNPDMSVRTRAARTSLGYPDIMDIRLVGEPQFHDIDPKLFGKPIPYLDQPHTYRYILNLDGLGMSTRLRTQLHTGSLLFKVDSPFKPHYTEDMMPWIHYVPVSWGNLEEDLPLKVQWAIEHDQAAQRIALNAREFARERLNDDSTAWYMQQALRAIAKREEASGEPFELIPGAVPFCCSHLDILPDEYKRQGLWEKACRDWSSKWSPQCIENSPNPAYVAWGEPDYYEGKRSQEWEQQRREKMEMSRRQRAARRRQRIGI